MGQNKFEKEIRQKLNSREISPSEKAWDRLDAMLSVAEKPKRNLRWLYVAASFLGFTLIGIVMFNWENEKMSNLNETEIVTTGNRETETEKADEFTPETETFSIPEHTTKAASKSRREVAEVKINKAEIQEEVFSEKDNHEQTVHQPEEAKITRYIDARTLLAEVEGSKEKTPVMIAQNPPVKVDAKELLTTAENEINETFRDKVIQSLNKNYNSFKTILANRNNE